MTRNLLKTREGVQYRRVKKLAEEMKRKHQTSLKTPSYDDIPIPIVRGIVTVNNELNLEKRRTKSIAPSFYPQSQNKNTRFSVEMAYRNNSFRTGNLPLEIANKRLFINGDDINVHCKGTRIYLWVRTRRAIGWYIYLIFLSVIVQYLKKSYSFFV